MLCLLEVIMYIIYYKLDYNNIRSDRQLLEIAITTLCYRTVLYQKLIDSSRV